MLATSFHVELNCFRLSLIHGVHSSTHSEFWPIYVYFPAQGALKKVVLHLSRSESYSFEKTTLRTARKGEQKTGNALEGRGGAQVRVVHKFWGF